MRTAARLLAACLLALCLCAQALAAPQGERRVALVIGNGAYREGPLKNPANDARDMAAALKSLGFEVTLRENATRRAMNEAIDAFWQSLRKGGTGLFFFAGHGLQVAGENYLVPVDAAIRVERDVQEECVSASRVLGRMENAGNSMNIVILDACRNNPFARAFRSADRGLAKMDAPTGSLVAFATAPGDVAADGEGKNGLYTSHLLRHLRTPGLKVEDVLKLTRIGVAADSARLGKRQTPWESSSLMGDFYFARGAGQAAAPVQPPAPIQTASLPGQQALQPQQEPAPRAWLGVEIRDADAEAAKAAGLVNAGGVLVVRAFPGSPAAGAGLQAGDIVLMLNGAALDTANALRLKASGSEPGTTLRLGYWRQGRMHEATATLAAPQAQGQGHSSTQASQQAAQAMQQELAGVFGQPAQAQRFRGSLEGTRWTTRCSIPETPTEMEFLPGGVLRYVELGNSIDRGATWRQSGNAVTITINDWAVYTGTVSGQAISGTAKNPKASWTWTGRLAQ